MKVYQGGCSFLKSPDIFVESELSNQFGNDLINVNNCREGSSNAEIFKTAFFSLMKSNFDFVIIGWTHSWRHHKVMNEIEFNDINSKILEKESNFNILNSMFGYQQIVGNSSKNIHCKFEPEATDDVIMYTAILHNLLNSKNIPHLFLSMGELNNEVLKNRTGWLELINPKNYFGKGNILEKMNNSITNNFCILHIEEGHTIHNSGSGMYYSSGYVRDKTNHLNYNGAKKLAEIVKNYIIENQLISI